MSTAIPSPISIPHDLAFASDPTLAKNRHVFAAQIVSPIRRHALALGMQEQTAVFFQSGGATIVHPTPVHRFELPLAGPLPETLGFIP